MASDSERFVKSYISFLGSAIWRDDGLFKLYHYCLYKASRNFYSWRDLQIKPGELPISHRNAASELGWSRDKLDKKLIELQRTGLITITTSTRGTLISVRNWSEKQTTGSTEIRPIRTDYQSTDSTENGPYRLENQTESGLKTRPNQDRDKKRDSYRVAPEPEGFSQLWLAYPAERRTRREEAATIFARAVDQGATMESMIAALETDKNSYDWSRESGRFSPGIVKWLQKEKWRDYLVKTSTEEDEPWTTW